MKKNKADAAKSVNKTAERVTITVSKTTADILRLRDELAAMKVKFDTICGEFIDSDSKAAEVASGNFDDLNGAIEFCLSESIRANDSTIFTE